MGAIWSAEDCFEGCFGYFSSSKTFQVPTEDEMDILKAKAMSLNLNFCVIKDAGRTQIAAGSKTVLAIGPGPQSLIGTEQTF